MPDELKVLVVLASYGSKNDRYLARVIAEYRSMSYDVDIVVLSNIAKEVGGGIELLVGSPTADPWSLPFGHQRIFADRLELYELFIYSEDDVLITRRNIEAFLEARKAFGEQEIPGFIRYEERGDGEINYPDIHGHFHWDPVSVVYRGEYTCAYFTNEHAGCYILTSHQLRMAISSKGFLVAPHVGKYDMLVSAATDPYTQCGFKKLICISHLDAFLVHHLPNKYVGTHFGVNHSELRLQLDALSALRQQCSSPSSLLETETRLTGCRYSKDYYEPIRPEIVRGIPSNTRSILSIGCGSGATETWLAMKGFRVVAVPLDPVISAGMKSKGVEIICGDFGSARRELSGQEFDCILFANLLHLIPNASDVLSSFCSLLSMNAAVIVAVPNVSRRSSVWELLRRGGLLTNAGHYEVTHVHLTSHGTIQRWFRDARLTLETIVDVLSDRAQLLNRLSLGALGSVLANEFIAIARRPTSHSFEQSNRSR